MAETLQQLLRERQDHDTPALKYGERVWTWREHLADAAATAVTQGMATPRLDHRSAADHGDQQDRQAGVDRSRRAARRRCALDAQRAKQGLHPRRSRVRSNRGLPSKPRLIPADQRGCVSPKSPGMRGRISVFGLMAVDLA